MPVLRPTIITACSNGIYIDTIIINTLNNSSSGCNGLPNNFISYPQNIFTTTLTAGGSYAIHLASGASGSQYFGIWVDCNHDNIYSPSEFLDSTTNLAYSITDNITIPSNAIPGLTSIRIRCATLPIHDTSACQLRNQGETEDYLVTIVNGVTTGIKQPNNGTISIYPNPATDYVYLNNLKFNASIEIFDLSGQSIKHIQNVHGSIDISELEKGMYFLQVSDHQKTETLKIIKE